MSADADCKKWRGREPTVEVCAQPRPDVLESAVRTAAEHDAGGRVQCRKVALECDVPRLHWDASPQALESPPAPVVPACKRLEVLRSYRPP